MHAVLSLIDLRRTLTLAFLILVAPLAQASDAEAQASLLRVAGLGPDARVQFAEAPNARAAFGVVLSAGGGKLVVLRRGPSGTYELEAQSAEFANDFGTGYYVEIVQAPGPDRFSVQVNAHSGCGVKVQTYRFARVHGAWRVAGYDQAEPDAQTCDVNLRSRDYSANLLTGRVLVTQYKSGKASARASRLARLPAPKLGDFHFAIFESEP